MKALLLLTAMATLGMVGCESTGPYVSSVSASYGYSDRVYRPAQHSYYQSNDCYRPNRVVRPTYGIDYNQQRTTIVGPQYYRAYDNGCGPTRYKNYSNAPVVLHRQGGTVIIPKSWD